MKLKPIGKIEKLKSESLIYISGGIKKFENTSRVDTSKGDTYPTKKKDWTWEN